MGTRSPVSRSYWLKICVSIGFTASLLLLARIAFSSPISTHQSPSPPQTELNPSCVPRYSSVRCTSNGFEGVRGVYGFPIYNRSCAYQNVTYDHSIHRFVFYTDPFRPKAHLQPVTLAPRGFDLPIMKWKREKVIKKMLPFHEYRPVIREGPIPCDFEQSDRTLLYYSPIVAPWNYAHTLFCDLFGLFWAMVELDALTMNALTVAVSAHYEGAFPLPNKNVAFEFLSRSKPLYDSALPPKTSFREVIMGSGTKSWSWVTAEYKASGSADMWWKFRRHIIGVTGNQDTRSAVSWTTRARRSNRLRLSVCHKKDGRSVENYEETVQTLLKQFPNMDVRLESAVGASAAEQVKMMLDADVFLCNEGTLATSFFLMPPGSAFISLPLVYHGPHLHQKGFSHWTEWWREPDVLRPDPRKNTGGNIDWFPPAIPWIRVSWYDYIPLNETKMQRPVQLRNYMPTFNIVLQPFRLHPLIVNASRYVLDPSPLVGHNPNYSPNAELCRQILARDASWTRAFNSVRCYYGMSWLCEFWTNTHFKWRFFHEKWRLSHGQCGSNMTSPSAWGLVDPRESRPLQDFLFYSKSRLEQLYTTTDFKNGHTFSAEPEDLRFL